MLRGMSPRFARGGGCTPLVRSWLSDAVLPATRPGGVVCVATRFASQAGRSTTAPKDLSKKLRKPTTRAASVVDPANTTKHQRAEATAQLLTPDDLRSLLVDDGGHWKDVDWAPIEEGLKRFVAADPSLVCDIEVLTFLINRKNIQSFMLNYKDFYDKALGLARRNATNKQEYLLYSAMALVAGSNDASCAARVIVRGQLHFVASCSGYDEIASRAIRISDELARLPVVGENDAPVRDLRSSTMVTVVSGESGSGKSTALLTCTSPQDVGVYVTASELQEYSVEVLGAQPREERHATVRKALCKLVSGLLKAVAPDIAQYPGELSVTVALDEMSHLPAFLRGLCGCLASIGPELKEQLGLEKDCTPSVALVVAGTGVDALAAAPGSLPGTFRVVRMATGTDAMLQYLLSHLRALRPRALPRVGPEDAVPDGLRSGERLAAAVERSHEARQLCGNPRYAAALYEFARQNFVGLYSDRAADAFVQLHIPVAAFRYKQLNGMQGSCEAEVRAQYMSALRLVFSGAPVYVSDADAALVRKFGVLTDRARWIVNERVPTDPPLVSLRTEDGHTLVSPATRFVMSAAQEQLFRMHYGFCALPDATWMGYEDSVADYLYAALLGCHGRTLGDLLRAMNPASRFAAERLTEAELGQPLGYVGVCRFDTVSEASALRISGESEERDLADLAACMDQNKAVVVVNAPKAAYADVVVMIPKVAVLLVQCKFYRDSSSFNAKGEVDKMSRSAVLQRVARCGVAVPVIVTSKKQVGEAGGFMLWETAADKSLSPLATPMPPLSRNRGDPPPKRVLVSEQATSADGRKGV